MTSEHAQLDCIFRPRSVAVIGASRKRGTIGAEIFHNLLFHYFQGVVYPVNPQAEVIQAVKAYKSILDIPDPVEMAVIVVPKNLVIPAARDCAKKGVKAMVVITAGFKETGPEGQAREKELMDICYAAKIRVVGPNCLGVLNTDSDAHLDATFAPTYPPSGNVSFSSQSGALGLTILDYAKELGIGISKFVSIGNKADVSGNDLIQYWDQDPNTSVILLYMESFGNPKKFLRIARDVGHRKPIVAVKSGRSMSGARAAASHTGSLAGSDATVRALFRQTGVIRTDTVEELFDMAMLLANQPLPQGNRVAILTNAGGPGIMAADACEVWGLKIPEISEQTQRSIQPLVAAEASLRNPVDMIASASAETFRKVIPILLADSMIDALLVLFVPPIITKPLEVAEAIVQGAEGTNKPVLTCFMGTHGVPEGLRHLKKGLIPSYAFPEAAVAALARSWEYSAWRKKPLEQPVEFKDFDSKAITKLTEKSGWLSPQATFAFLDAAKIPTVQMRHARTATEASNAAKELGFPVVLKIDSEKILHKTEFGGIALNLKSEPEVKSAAEEMLKKANRAGIANEGIRGFVVQSMIEGGREIIVGANDDGKFGHLFMFGLGGVEVELLRDVAFRVHPFTPLDVKEMMREVRGAKLLDGFRGSSPCDTAAIENIILRLAHLVTLVPKIAEFDLNPIKVMDRGKGAIVVDGRIRIA